MGRSLIAGGLATAFVTATFLFGSTGLNGDAPQVEAGEAEPGEAETDSKPSSEEQVLLRAAREHVSQLELHGAEDADEVIACIDHALLSYGDPARKNTQGTLWAFGASGRPVAFLELWQGGANQNVWYQSVISTGDRKIAMKTPFGGRWTPPDIVVSRYAIEDAPRPAHNKPERLRQAKSLTRRFTAHEIGDPDRSRAELRLLVQPVHRYEDPRQGIQDGAAFIFAHGTNPELILLVEAIGKTVADAQWRYSLFPSSSAELHAELDGREAWTRPVAPGVIGQPTDDYWLFSLPVEAKRSR